jgi:RES domain-containing protein
MELFRILLEKYAGALTSSGAANRWNPAGQSVLYAGSSRSLSTLELVVHRSAIRPTENYKVMVLSVADEDRLVEQVQVRELPTNWRTIAAYGTLQKVGSNWYTRQEYLLLKVPSAVIVQEHNYLINVTHPDFEKKIKLVRTEDYFWDGRLLS